MIGALLAISAAFLAFTVFAGMREAMWRHRLEALEDGRDLIVKHEAEKYARLLALYDELKMHADDLLKQILTDKTEAAVEQAARPDPEPRNSRPLRRDIIAAATAYAEGKHKERLQT